MDKSTRKAWELFLGDRPDFPEFKESDSFLHTQICALESINACHTRTSSFSSQANKSNVRINSYHATTLSHSIDSNFARAEKLLHCVERRLNRSDFYRESYAHFMREYEDMGHMRQVNNLPPYCTYLPHHPVVKMIDQFHDQITCRF